MSHNGNGITLGPTTPKHSPPVDRFLAAAVDRFLAAARPRPWAELSSAQRSEQMDAALTMLSDVTEAHNRLNRAVVDYMAAQMERIEALERSVNDERLHRLKLADEQRSYVDARDRELKECCQQRWDASSAADKRGFDAFYALRNRGFWSRLNWLVTGR